MFMQSTESIPLTLYGGIEVNGVPAYTTPKQAALGKLVISNTSLININ